MQTTLPKITNKQQKIIKLLYNFRFLNRIQIQFFLNHKDHKRINEWLRDLTKKEYINRIYSTNFGENNKPAIYYVGPSGIRYLKTLNDCPLIQIRKLYHDKNASGRFIERSILLGDIYLHLRDKSDQETKFKTTLYSEILHENSPYNFMVDEISPDIIFIKDIKKEKKHFLLEIFEPALPKYSIRKRIRKYLEFYFSAEWEENIGPDFPTLLFVCPTLSTLIFSKRFTKKLFSEYDDEFNIKVQFTTEREVKENGLTSEIWEEI